MPSRIELSGDQPRHQTAIGGQHLVGADHWKPVADQHDDLGFHTGQLRRQHDVSGHLRNAAPISVIVPMNAKQVACVRPVGIGAFKILGDRPIQACGIGQLRNPGQADAGVPKPVDAPLIDCAIDDIALKSDGHPRPLLLVLPDGFRRSLSG